eukprot:558115-Amphidinium_carterae.1
MLSCLSTKEKDGEHIECQVLEIHVHEICQQQGLISTRLHDTPIARMEMSVPERPLEHKTRPQPAESQTP